MEKTELFRLVFLLKAVINRTEKCVSMLRNSFLNGSDFKDAERTVERLDIEIRDLEIQIKEQMDGEQ